MTAEAPDDGELHSAGGDFDSIRVSVRIVGDHLHVDRVTEMMGVEPSFAAEAGGGALRWCPAAYGCLDGRAR